MLKRNLWKLIASFFIVLWAVLMLLPLQDQPFAGFVRAEASAKTAEFGKLLDEVAALKKSRTVTSDYVGLRQLARERRIDLSQYFPDIRLESGLKNIEKRNDILLTELQRRAKGRLQLGLDLKGGVAFTLEVDEAMAKKESLEERKQNLSKAIEIISQRINSFGVAEPIIRAVGHSRIEVQLPSESTKENPEVVDLVKKPARLDFRLVHPTLTPGPGVETPAGYAVLSLDHEGQGGELSTEELFVKILPEMTGEAIERSFARPDMYGKPEVILMFTDAGRKSFAVVTREIASQGQRGGRLGRLAIVLDGKLYSAPTVREEIDSPSAQITGSFSDREAIELANVLNNPLDMPLIIKEQYEVGPTLADDAVVSGRMAFLISTVLTIGFMLVFYTYGGVVAAIGMGVNVLITLGTMAHFGATLSMPGLAGIVLTLAMSVDSNILIFERMREELRTGKSLGTALEAGFDKAWSAILDSNLTTLIVAAIMIWLGNGPVKGFGVTLAIGIFTTMFAAVVVSKLVLEFLIHPGIIKRLPMLVILQDTKVDFARLTKPALYAAGLVVLVGVASIAIKGRSIYGIDFVGGDQVTLEFKKKVDVGTLRDTAKNAGVTDVNFSYQQQIGTSREVLKVTTPFDQGKALVEKLQQSLPQADLKLAGESRIGPSIGEEIQWNALWSLVCSFALILVYVAFRFELGYAIGAIVAVTCSLVMNIGIFVLFDRQFNASMVAAILLVVGYGINDTIVVFDRIREELKINPTGTLREVINRSLNLTLSRTIITGGTTLMTALVFIFVTQGDVNDIAFTLLIGVLASTFASLFIASPVFYWWHKGDRKHVEAHHDIAPKYEWQGSSKASQ